jgi:hypothetical protein
MKKYINGIIYWVIVLVSIIWMTVSCTQNQRAKTFGGNAKIELPAGQKLINATWKDDNLWYLTRPMKSDEQPETYKFQEASSFGILEGTYTITERR